MRSIWLVVPFALLAWGSPLGQNLLARWRNENLAPDKNRYEGHTAQLVSGERIELLSFTRSMPRDLHNARLRVRYFQNAGSKVVIVARDIEDAYRMESLPLAKPEGWSIFFPWPTAFQLEQMKIEPDDLGVVAYSTTDGIIPPPSPVTVIPVAVFSEGDAETRGADAYVVELRSNFRMRGPEWRVQDNERKTKIMSSEVAQEGSPKGTIAEKEAFRLSIPFSQLETSGKFELLFTAKAWSTNQFYTLDLWFHHQQPWGR